MTTLNDVLEERAKQKAELENRFPELCALMRYRGCEPSLVVTVFAFSVDDFLHEITRQKAAPIDKGVMAWRTAEDAHGRAVGRPWHLYLRVLRSDLVVQPRPRFGPATTWTTLKTLAARVTE